MNPIARYLARFQAHRADAPAVENLSFDGPSVSGLVSGQVSGLEMLQARLCDWSHVWGAESGSALNIETQKLVADRLTQWFERCFGHNAQRSLGDPISLASSLPIFTAFLGRRATRELSRRILQDI
jgi:hypothetical protein